MQLLRRKINSLVEENYVYGRALDSIGVDFSEQKDEILENALQKLGIQKSLAINSFYDSDTRVRPSFRELRAFPLPYLISYLRYSHTQYIKDYLPYIHKVIERIPDSNQEAVRDLKQVFPLFLEDFVHHIYEEEDKLFNYILVLMDLSRESSVGLSQIPVQYIDYSLSEIFEDHVDEDEMANLRELVDEIKPKCLETKVAVSEIRSFDRELNFHAEIENQLLFPRAIDLEKKIWREIQSIK